MKFNLQAVLEMKAIRLPAATALLVWAAFAGGCSVGSGRGDTGTVAFVRLEVADTSIYALSTSEQCEVVSSAVIECPDGQSADLCRLYSSAVLDLPADSVISQWTARRFLKNVIAAYCDDADLVADGTTARETSMTVRIEANVTATRNSERMVTFCKRLSMWKDGEQVSSAHYYYNLSLAGMSKIELPDLISESSLADVGEMLKMSLIEQAGVKNEAALIDLGYFNLDNLSPNNNFRITDDSVTWVYAPLDIACFSVGEVEISLSLDNLRPYMQEAW